MSSTLQALKPRAMNCFMAALRMALRVERRGKSISFGGFSCPQHIEVQWQLQWIAMPAWGLQSYCFWRRVRLNEGGEGTCPAQFAGVRLPDRSCPVCWFRETTYPGVTMTSVFGYLLARVRRSRVQTWSGGVA